MMRTTSEKRLCFSAFALALDSRAALATSSIKACNISSVGSSIEVRRYFLCTSVIIISICVQRYKVYLKVPNNIEKKKRIVWRPRIITGGITKVLIHLKLYTYLRQNLHIIALLGRDLTNKKQGSLRKAGPVNILKTISLMD